MSKPKTKPTEPFADGGASLHQQGPWLWIPLRNEWRDIGKKPEEKVRQEFIRHLVVECGYSLDQMDQERRTMHGHKSPRVDVVLWASPAKKAANQDVILVVECKAENVEIQIRDYYQGESYTRACGAELMIAHNARHTAVFKLVPGAPGEFVQINDFPKAADWSDAARLERIRNSLRTFNRDEFQRLLFDCHCLLRDVHAMEPGRAFDTISKVLFIKMYVERAGLHGTFSVDFLDRREATRMKDEAPVHVRLFEQTKDYYKADELFAANDTLEISDATFRDIVKKLERFNLSQTGDDIKGIAFERFLGTTFRGELGQFFTPRPVVDFMVELLDPKEGESICDPASGSGGFLIKAFEHVRSKILDDIQRQKDEARAAIEALNLDPDEERARVDAEFARLNQELLPSGEDNRPVDTRVGRLAWRCVYGCDKEPRAARTAKMNMIMHGDGHGGIHYHDGLVDINGIFDGRFDAVLTNPPFGANVGENQKVGASEETRVPDDLNYRYYCAARYGEPWKLSHAAVKQAAEARMKILDLYVIGKDKANRATEVLFVERCLNLLKPGGRMGIVLPNGNLNTPSLAWLRRWVEGEAKLLAVVALPEETFRSAKATVTASLVFLKKFDAGDREAWEAAWAKAHAGHDPVFNARRNELHAAYAGRIVGRDDPALAGILEQLEALGVRRVLVRWQQGEPPAYPRGVGPTKVDRPVWLGEPEAKNRKAVAALKRRFGELWQGAARAASDSALAELRAKLKAVDEAHAGALWKTVREVFDYPVFVAAPKTVGITSTGETGGNVANELPEVLREFRRFLAWVEAGAGDEGQPDFHLPSAA